MRKTPVIERVVAVGVLGISFAIFAGYFGEGAAQLLIGTLLLLAGVFSLISPVTLAKQPEYISRSDHAREVVFGDGDGEGGD